MSSQHPIVHPGWLRATHWLNAIAVAVLVMSGWRIYNATAFLGFAIPKGVTLGGWLGGLLGMLVFRHKTAKLSFKVKYAAGFIVWVGLLYFAITMR